jgi:hypothetical protein
MAQAVALIVLCALQDNALNRFLYRFSELRPSHIERVVLGEALAVLLLAVWVALGRRAVPYFGIAAVYLCEALALALLDGGSPDLSLFALAAPYLLLPIVVLLHSEGRGWWAKVWLVVLMVGLVPPVIAVCHALFLQPNARLFDAFEQSLFLVGVSVEHSLVMPVLRGIALLLMFLWMACWRFRRSFLPVLVVLVALPAATLPVVVGGWALMPEMFFALAFSAFLLISCRTEPTR